VDRRSFLAAAGAALACRPSLSASFPPVLRLGATLQSLVGSAYPATAVWAFNGTVPGPELRVRQGEPLRIEVENRLDASTTVHWHGIRLPNAMDGVPGVTQAPIAPQGGRFTYEFTPPDAGTFWYHPHLGAPEQVGRGLYGALVVEEREPPRVDRDVVWLLSDWRLDGDARIVADFGNFRDASHDGRIGNTVTVNGSIRESFEVRAGERIRLRLINASAARIYALSFAAHAPWLIALDGHPLPPHKAERIVLGSGMRADLLLDCTAPPGSRHRVVDDFYPRRAYRLLDLQYAAAPPLDRALDVPPPLKPNPVAEPDLAQAARHMVRFEGGMMGRMPIAREHRALAWSVNGRAVAEHAHHHEPLLSLQRGRSYVIELVNDTSWHHPIHLHGHAFRVLSQKGAAHPQRPLMDSVLLEPDSRAEIALVADNPGDWMLHCHVLEHQASGMMGLVRVG
jgi:FtsP/CotA-like multicopper oxidase with cupredoxin domain